MNWKKQAIGLAIGFGVASVPAASADMGTLGSVERYHAEINRRTTEQSCDERFRSYESRQMSPSRRRSELETCQRLAREAAAIRIATDRPAAPRQVADHPATR